MKNGHVSERKPKCVGAFPSGVRRAVARPASFSLHRPPVSLDVIFAGGWYLSMPHEGVDFVWYCRVW